MYKDLKFSFAWLLWYFAVMLLYRERGGGVWGCGDDLPRGQQADVPGLYQDN